MATKKKTTKNITDLKKKAGRPSNFGKVNPEAVKLMAQRGFTDIEMCKCLHVSEKTWNLWKVKNQDFYEALSNWKAKADESVERSLYERAIGYEHPEEKIFCYEGEVIKADTVHKYAPDVTACIFWLKNRKPKEWRDRSHIVEEVEFKIGDVDVEGLTTEEMLDVMMKKATIAQIRARKANK